MAAIIPILSSGLHVDLGEWAFRDQCWVPAYQVVPQTLGRRLPTKSRASSSFSAHSSVEIQRISTHISMCIATSRHVPNCCK